MEGAKIASRKQLIDSEIGDNRRGTTITITITITITQAKD
jgi:hypothetical protein